MKNDFLFGILAFSRIENIEKLTRVNQLDSSFHSEMVPKFKTEKEAVEYAEEVYLNLQEEKFKDGNVVLFRYPKTIKSGQISEKAEVVRILNRPTFSLPELHKKGLRKGLCWVHINMSEVKEKMKQTKDDFYIWFDKKTNSFIVVDDPNLNV
jgi:hypothetical protein